MILTSVLLVMVLGMIFVDADLVDPTNPTPIKFTLGSVGGGTVFEIPRHNFEYRPHAETVGEFTIKLRLPDLVPESVAAYDARQSELSDVELKALRRHSSVRVKVSASRNYAEMRNLQSSILPDEIKEHMKFEEVSDLLYLGDEMRYRRESRGTITLFEGYRNGGIKYRKNHEGNVTKGFSVGNRYFVPQRSSGKEGFYIECAKPWPERPMTYCRIKKDLSSNIRVDIGFSFDQFPDWKTVDEKVTDFLKSHMKN